MARQFASVKVNATVSNNGSILHPTKPLKPSSSSSSSTTKKTTTTTTIIASTSSSSLLSKMNIPAPRSKNILTTPAAVTLPPRRSELEERLQFLVKVEPRLTPPETLDDIRHILLEIRRRRQARKAVVSPSYYNSNSRRPPAAPLASTHSHIIILAQACEATNETAAKEILSVFYNNHYSHSSSSAGRSLVAAALAELMLKNSDNNSDISEALSLLDIAVADRHAGAMLQVGLCLKNGRGVPKDLIAGLEWIERAAVAGYAPAMFELGAIYEDGVISVEENNNNNNNISLESDWGEAMYWYRAAAELGHVMSQLNIGKLLLRAATAATAHTSGSNSEAEMIGWNINDIENLREKSHEWLERAAAAGLEEAVRLLRYK